MMFSCNTNALQLTFPSCTDAHNKKLQGNIGNWGNDTCIRVTREINTVFGNRDHKTGFLAFLDTDQEGNLCQGHNKQVLL